MTYIIIIRTLCTTLLCSPTAEHQLDADAFPAGTIVNDLFAGVRLDVVDASGNRPPDSDVLAHTPIDPGHASTGSSNFAWKRGRRPTDGWNRTAERFLRIEFDQPVERISIDFISHGGRAAGFLHAFDADGNRIGEMDTAMLFKPGAIETLLFESATPIGYALAGGLGYDSVSLDGIRYAHAPQPIPAPGAAMLGVTGLASIGIGRRFQNPERKLGTDGTQRRIRANGAPARLPDAHASGSDRPRPTQGPMK